MHTHHIMPRHLGGNNEPDNLVEVSAEEHAEIHRCLWVYGGMWQDELAWRILSGRIGREEAISLAISKAKKGKPREPNTTRHNQNISLGSKGKPKTGNQKLKGTGRTLAQLAADEKRRVKMMGNRFAVK